MSISATARGIRNLAPGTEGSTVGHGNPVVRPEAEAPDPQVLGAASDVRDRSPTANPHSGITGGQTTEGSNPTTKSLEIGGSSILIEESAGSETITINHASGAGIVIGSDGTVSIVGASQKDLVISSPNIAIVASDALKLSASRMFIDTSVLNTITNDLVTIVRGDMHETVEGSREMNTDGYHSMSVTKEYNEIVAGDKRTTVAGDERSQTTGERRIEVDQRIYMKANQNINVSSQKSINLNAERQIAADAKEEFTASAKGSMLLETQAKASFIANETMSISATDGIYNRTDSQYTISSRGKINIDADDTIDTRAPTIISHANQAYVVRSEAAEIHADETMDIRSGEGMTLFSGDVFDARAKADLKLSTEAMLDTRSNITAISSNETLNINAGGGIDIRGSTIDLNFGPPNPQTPEEADDPTTYQDQETTETPKIDTEQRDTQEQERYNLDDLQDSAINDENNRKAQTASENNIQDTITTEGKDLRKDPAQSAEYPGNGNLHCREHAEYSTNGTEGSAHTRNPREYYNQMNQNRGAVSSPPVSDGGTWPDGAGSETSGNSFVGNSNVAEVNPMPALSNLFNGSAKLSRKVTCSMIWGKPGLPSSPAKEPNANGLRRAGGGPNALARIIANIQHICWNICDPIFNKEGNAIRINHVLRRGRDGRATGSSKHFTGEAVDFQFKDARNLEKHVQLTRWIIDNLPFSAVYLERMEESGNYVIHVECQPAGQKGGGTILTCRNADCSIRRFGLVPQFINY